jgi:hypothetical protein
MRKTMLAICIGFLLFGFRTSKPISEDQLRMEKTFDTSLSRDAAFDKGAEWIAKTFAWTRSPLEYQNKVEGKMIARGRVGLPRRGTTDLPVTFSMTFVFEAGKYTLSFTHVDAWYSEADNRLWGIYTQDQVDTIHGKFQALCEDFSQYLTAGR